MARDAQTPPGSIGLAHLSEHVRNLLLNMGGVVSTQIASALQQVRLAFTALTDVPGSYTGQAGKVVAVADDESGLVFSAGSVAVRARGVAVTPQPLSGLISVVTPVDGQGYADGEVILCVAQPITTDNGPWVVRTGVWDRPDGWGETQGELIQVEGGSTGAGTLWQLADAATHAWVRRDARRAVIRVAGNVAPSAHWGPQVYVGVTAVPIGGMTVTLPSAASCKGTLVEVKAETNTIGGGQSITIARTAPDLIDGAPSTTIAGAWLFRRLVSDGTGWFTI